MFGKIVCSILYINLYTALSLLHIEDTIVALATPGGVGAIAVIRISGQEAFPITNALFKGKDLTQQASHTLHFGTLHEEGVLLDEVVVSLFRAPKSFTKEDVIEISCHGSEFIVRKIIQALLKKGARLAKPGEFTQRAFLNGRFDLAQAEAVADLIASDSEASHRVAMQQMRGGFSKKIKDLREKLIHFASLIELELDFGEEDVEFANRTDLKNLVITLTQLLNQLIQSFDLGNVIKNGVPTVIAGRPNAGKSTLLNILLNEEKAIVSDIPGTTRDFIEDELTIEGVRFRLIDTAGLRETTDTIEAMGVARTRQKMEQASLLIYLFDASITTPESLEAEIADIRKLEIPLLLVGNKVDRITGSGNWSPRENLILISASQNQHIDMLRKKMLELIDAGQIGKNDTLVTNVRHYENLRQTRESLEDVLRGLDIGITGDLLALDIRNALHYLGEITGEITTDDLLDNIFSKFCIGK
jgi:tRNA modification GTPase